MPSDLVSQANHLSDLSRLGSYRLKAMIVLGGNKNTVPGILTMEHDQENMKQEIRFSDYQEISLIRGNTGYLQRQPDSEIFALEPVHRFEDLWWVIILAGSETRAVSEEKVHETQALCFTAELYKTAKDRYCFDAATHFLLSHSTNVVGGNLEILFLDYQSMDDVHFPGTIRLIGPGQEPFELRNIAVEKTAFPETEFTPPQGARAYATCRHLEKAVARTPIYPEYPSLARLARIQGTTRLKATVGEDGKVRKVTPLSGHPMLMEPSSSAIKRTRYKPATCPAGPVEDDILVTVQYSIR